MKYGEEGALNLLDFWAFDFLAINQKFLRNHDTNLQSERVKLMKLCSVVTFFSLIVNIYIDPTTLRYEHYYYYFFVVVMAR